MKGVIKVNFLTDSGYAINSKKYFNRFLRLCVDMCNANAAIQRTRFPTTTVDDLIFRLRNVRYFTKLDLNAAFHQLELNERSRYITAFQTEDRI